MADRICKRCGQLTADNQECPVCAEWFKTRPDPITMTPDERATEFESWKFCEIYFDKVHQRMEELVGRPIWTHEIGLNWAGLKEEARLRTGEFPTLEKLTEDIPLEKLIIVET